jgi:hypothetical protein
MDGFDIQPVPALRSPVVVIAFGGWSDTGTVTTDAAQRLIDTNGGQSFLTVDPEDYYVFTDTRPTVRLDAFGLRELQWPKNEAFYARTPQAPSDLVVVKGIEPNLRWRTFTERLGGAIAELTPSLVCTLVARPATTPHTRPIPVSGSSADAELAKKYGLGRSNYQGPTGIVGVLHDVLRRKGCPLISLVASVPHYLNVDENPPATMALLKALTPVVGFAPSLGDLDEQGVRFLERVEEASRGDDQIRAYVRSLEEHYGEGEQALTPQPSGELPSAADILKDVEDLLRGGADT